MVPTLKVNELTETEQGFGSMRVSKSLEGDRGDGEPRKKVQRTISPTNNNSSREASKK